jgi:hypothetical protein
MLSGECVVYFMGSFFCGKRQAMTSIGSAIYSQDWRALIKQIIQRIEQHDQKRFPD